MFIQQYCFQQRLHQMMTLGSGMVSGRSINITSPVVSNDTTRLLSLYGIAISTLIQLEPYFLLSDGGSPRLFKNVEGELAMKSDFDRKYICYPAISDTLFSQIHIFFQLTFMCLVVIFFKRGR